MAYDSNNNLKSPFAEAVTGKAAETRYDNEGRTG